MKPFSDIKAVVCAFALAACAPATQAQVRDDIAVTQHHSVKPALPAPRWICTATGAGMRGTCRQL